MNAAVRQVSERGPTLAATTPPWVARAACEVPVLTAGGSSLKSGSMHTSFCWDYNACSFVPTGGEAIPETRCGTLKEGIRIATLYVD